MKKRILSFAIAVCMMFGCATVLPEGAFDGFTSIFASAEEETDSKEIHEYTEISYSYNGTKNKTYQFTYKDDMFNTNSTVLSTDLAKMSVGLAMAAYKKGEIKGCLDAMGFDYTDESFENYSKVATYEDNDFVAYTIANKITTFNGEKYNIVVVPIRGTHGDPEWFSDFNLGIGPNHKGFYAAAQEINMKLWNFLNGYKQYDSDHTIILTTGHSRGAAVANIVAGMYSTSAAYNKFASRNHVFAYTFACPAVSKDADESLLNIYNYNNCGDVIPELPLKGEGWEYKRFGRTITLEAKGLEYQNFLQRFKLHNGKEYAGMTDTTLWIEFFRALADTPDEYNEPFNQLLFGIPCAWLGPGEIGEMQLLAKVFTDYQIKQDIEFLDASLLGKIKIFFSDLYNITKTIVNGVCDLKSLTYYLYDDDLTNRLSEIAEMLVDTNGMTDEDFTNYIRNKSINKIEEEAEIEIKTRDDLIAARQKIYKISNDANRIAPKLATLINLFFASENDVNNPNSEGSFGGLKSAIWHAHTGDTYILWINSLYYGFEGWKGTDVAPESLPDNITTLGYNCFRENTALESISIPIGTEYISIYDFYHCTNLKSVIIPDSVTSVGNQAFSNCIGLKEVTIPCDLNTYYDNYGAFCYCRNVETIHYTYGKSGKMYDRQYYEMNNTIEYLSHDSLAKVTFDNRISHIGNHAFFQATALKSVVLPSNLESIGERAFENCSSLTNIDLPDGLESIGTLCFSSSGLEKLELPSTLKEIPTYMCSYCHNLTSIEIPDTVVKIGDCAFEYCTGIREISIPCDLDMRRVYHLTPFYRCENINSIHYSYGKTGIMKDYATYDTLITENTIIDIEFENSITHIGDWSLCHADSLNQVNLPSSLESIGDYAFLYCKSLTNIDLPDKVTSIGSYCFANSGLEKISLPSNLESLGMSCLANSGLEKLSLPSSLTTIPQNMCNNCTSLAELSIPNSITTIGSYAFHNCDELKTVTYDGYKEDWDKISIGEYNEPLENVQCKVKLCDHEYNSEVTTPATCTTDGVRTYTCSKCNDSYTEVIEAAGHIMGKWTVTTKPTCTANGVETRKCKNCDKTETRDVAALDHAYVETVVPPTCTTKGYTNHKCSRCGDEYNDTETDMIAHKFGEWTVTTKPTCTTKGVETRKCENCDKTETRDVDALGHDYVETIVLPTCTTKGYTNHKCSRCGDEYNDSEISIVDHTYGDWDIKSYDSKTGESKLERKCINCTHTETKTEKNIVQRYAGSGRFATAAEISKGSFETAKTVVLAYGLNSADALAGVPLAAKYNAPILLTNTKTLPNETFAEIKRLKATNVIILGGEGAIGKDVEKLLKKEGLTTQRIAGKTRFGTATAIAEQLAENPEEIFFVYAFNFADALSASTVSAVKGAPIIYLKTNGDIDSDTAAYLAKVKGKVKKAYVIGGTGVISDDMMNKAKNALGLDTITRVAGANRYATCIEVNNTFKDYLTGNGICVAKGLDFPDALAGGVFAALKKMPLFLADGSLKDVQTNYLGNKDISNVYVFGGTGAVPDELIEKLAKAS